MFSGARSFPLGRYPRDSQFYLINCNFSDSTRNIIDTNAPDSVTKDFKWGRRVFFYGCKKQTAASWLEDNLTEAPGSPNASDVTAEWTFEHQWNPERTDKVKIIAIKINKVYRTVDLIFSEPVTVRGNPVLKTVKGKSLIWTGVNGTNTLRFSSLDTREKPSELELGTGSIFASAPSVTTRNADLDLPNK